MRRATLPVSFAVAVMAELVSPAAATADALAAQVPSSPPPGPGPAATPAPPAPPPAERPSEWGLVALEGLGASAAGVLVIGGTYAGGGLMNLEPAAKDRVVLAALVFVPLLEGLTVCAIGTLSDHYKGRCLGPVIGAYASAALFVPIAFLASANQQDALGKGIVAAFFLGVGFVIAAPAGATIAWNLKKEPRETASAQLAPPRRLPLALPERRRGFAATPPAALTIPFVALRF